MTKIEWTEKTWNPVVGCSIVSPGCTNCYAMTMAARIERMGGAPRSPKSAAQWFSRACTAAGLEGSKAAHGIRKHRAAVFKENGASADQRMAILGHETATEAARYSKSADLQKIIARTESSQPPNQSSQSAKKRNENNGM